MRTKLEKVEQVRVVYRGLTKLYDTEQILWGQILWGQTPRNAHFSPPRASPAAPAFLRHYPEP